MAPKHVSIFLVALCMLFASLSTAHGGARSSRRGAEVPVGTREQVIKYYIHDNLLQRTGNTAFIVAGREGNVTHLNQGSIVAINDLITEEPGASSRKLGNAQGLYLISTSFSPELPHIHQQFTAVFTEKYNGTIAYQGDDNLLLPVREIAVVGGTGQFRSASGYCLITTIKQTDAWSFILGFETHLFVPQMHVAVGDK